MDLAMSPQSPLWRRGFDRLERMIGEPLEVVAHSDAFFEGIARARRTQEALEGLAEGLSRRSLHLFGVPSRSEIRHLREQLAHVERQLRAISKQLVAQASQPPTTARERSGASEQAERPSARQPHQSDGSSAPRATPREPASPPPTRSEG